MFKCKHGVNLEPGDPNYDLFLLAIKCFSKRMYPNFVNVDATYNKQYYVEGNPDTEIATMGCRTRVMSDRHGWIGVSGKGNISPCTINLVRCGIENGLLYTGKIDVEGFYKQLKSYLDIAMEELLDRYEYQASQLAKMSDFMMREGIWRHGETLDQNSKVEELLKHGTLSIGFVGLAECMAAMFGKHHAEDKYIYDFGYNVIKYIRDYCDKMSDKYDMNITCYATPAESTCGRFVKIDKERFGVLTGVTDREYYTNSYHVPVYYPITIEDKIDLEAPFHELCNAGHITYVELTSNVANNLEAVEAIIKYALSKNIGYFAMNIPIDRCENCGYEGEIPEDDCPICHSEDIARLRRVTGLFH